MTSKQPWEVHTETGYQNKVWNTAEFPFVVRWSVPVSDLRTRWISHNRAFKTMEEAIAAYKLPFRGLSVDCVMYNGGKPGQHLDTLAYRKACKSTKWNDKVPMELRS